MLCKVTLHTGHALANTRPIQLCWCGQEMGTNNYLDEMHASNVFVPFDGRKWLQMLVPVSDTMAYKMLVKCHYKRDNNWKKPEANLVCYWSHDFVVKYLLYWIAYVHTKLCSMAVASSPAGPVWQDQFYGHFWICA